MPRGIPNVKKGKPILVREVIQERNQEIDEQIQTFTNKYPEFTKGKHMLVCYGRRPHNSRNRAWRVKVKGLRVDGGVGTWDNKSRVVVLVSALDKESQKHMKEWFGYDYGAIEINSNYEFFEIGE